MADTSFVIDIASQVSGVSATTSELNSIADQVGGVAAKAAVFDDAIAKLEGDLKTAAAATAAANQALAEGKTHYAQLEKSAVQAAEAVEKLEAAEAQIPAAQAALGKAQGALDTARAAGAASGEIKKLEANVKKAAGALRRTKAAASGLDSARAAAASASAAAEEYAGDLDKMEREAEQAAAAQSKLEHSLQSVQRVQGRVNDRLGDSATNLSTFRGALGDIGGPIAEFGERLLFPAQAFVDLREKFGRGVAVMTVGAFGLLRVGTAVAGALLKITAAAVAGLAALGAYAIVASDAARALAITREASEVLTPALRGIPWDEITNATGVAGDRLNALAASLVDAKISAEEMPAALAAVAAAESVLGTAGAAKYSEAMRSGSESVTDFANRVERELGDKVARHMLGLEAQGGRFKRNISALFNDFEIEPVLLGLNTLVSLFDENSVTGKALRAALHGIFDPLIENAREAAYVVEAFLLGVAIGATELYIKVKPAIDAIVDLLEDVLDAAATAGEYLVPVALGLVAALAFVGAGVVVVVAVIAGLTLALLAVPIAVAAVVGALVVAVAYLGGAVVDAVTAAHNAVAAFISEFVQAGKDLVGGLAAGITANASAVLAAITGVVGGAINAAKSALGIASDSKVFIKLGSHTAGGMARGVDSGRREVHESIAGISDVAQLPVNTSGIEDVGRNAIHDAVASADIPEAPPASTPGSPIPSSAPAPSTSTSTSSTITIQKVEFPGGAEAVEAFQTWLENLALQGASS
jgi:hypothetical protein